ncbi:MAG: bifunctional diguanylate cyclase/phosphodiesterase [Clostridia bacterium]|nr:bifunctional diguanylate cyclase/phosphodiesterase [Clostridia bacterium]
MSTDKTVHEHTRAERLLNGLPRRRPSSYMGFVLLLLLYTGAHIATLNLSHRQGGMIEFFGIPTPITSFAGVFSSLANFCLILLVVIYARQGFYTALIVLTIQILSQVLLMFTRQNMSSIPGLFMALSALVTICLIHNNSMRTRHYQTRLREQAITDQLTGLPNKFACSELINALVSRGETFAVVSIDLNHFKSINNTMGRNTGNRVLIEVANRWKQALEAGKSGTRDFLACQGGVEFTLVLQGYGSPEDIERTIAYYNNALEQKLTLDSCDYYITASYGYAEYPADAQDGDTLLTYAFSALYEAKRTTSRVCRFTPGILQTEQTLEIERKIRAALERNTLCFYLQPQFDISHRLRGFEALARLKDEDGSFISPAQFIPVAEKAGLIDKIDRRIFRDSAMFLGELIRRTGTDFTLSVNVSARHLMRNDFLDEVRSIVNTCDFPVRDLEIEITESVMIDSAEEALNCIKEIKRMGARIALDDFGTGYSSLSYLNTFPADILKVDKSFIDKMNSSDSSKQYVAAIISIGHIMNFDVISEGVEEPEQLDTLRSIGCDYIQGYIWGRPLPPEEAEALVLDSVAA